MKDIRKCRVVVERNSQYAIYYFDGLFYLKMRGEQKEIGYDKLSDARKEANKAQQEV